MEEGFDGDLLRRDPAAFFGLDEGFDAKDLRRAYHAAIRRFRPDSHPREFQLLREAHDRLGRWTGQGIAHQAPGTGDGARLRSPTSGPLDTPARRSAAYRDLSVDARDPEDFVALALLADSTPGADRGFDSWVLEGLAKHPGDEGLESLLRIYQQEDLSAAEVPRFLRRAANALPSRVAWSLTRYAWESAALEVPFPEFLSLWEQCRSPEDDLDEKPRAVLLAYLLPLLAPSADREWLDRTVAWLGKRHDLLGDGGAVLDAIEMWMPLRDAVDEERRTRPKTRGGGGRFSRDSFWKIPLEPTHFPGGPDAESVKDLIGAMLAAGCRGGGDRLARAAAAVVDREEGVLEAFRPPAVKLTDRLGRFAQWTGPLAAHHASFEPVREPKEEARIVYAVHRSVDQAVERTWDSFLFGAARGLGLEFLDPMTTLLGGLLLLALFMAGGFAFSGNNSGLPSDSVAKLVFGLVMMGSSLLGAYLLYKHPSSFWGKLQGRLALAAQRRCYFRRIRPVVVGAVTELGLPPEALVDPRIISERDVSAFVKWAVLSDPALPVLRLAHRFAP